ncbi:hypothetical protein AVBRAN9333_01510 [Campylobacter sp. RM9333]|uniref:hypothetical protein n=1 Tax=Campylobacter sp. RM9333 TaxID=2735731 RepID=UPI001DC66203|nr:hypothetical protein [Campylobacter sp. RM9333]
MQKGAIDLDIARQTKDDKIAQEQIKTANDMETLKQSQFATKTQPEIFKMQKENHKANLSNTYSIISERKQNMFFKDQAYKEQVEAKKVMSDFNEFSLKFPNLKGDDLKNAYYKHLNYMQMAAFNDPLATDTPTQIANAQKYLDKQRLFEKHLGYTGQGYRANEDNFNPIPKGSGNSANSMNDYFGVLDKVSQISDTKENLEKELKDIDSKILLAKKDGEKENIIKLEQRKDELKNNLKQYGNINIPNVGVIHTLGALQQIYGKEEGLNRQNELENLAAQKKLLNTYAGLIEEANWHGWNGNVVNKSLNILGYGTVKDNLREVAKQIKVLAQTKSMKLKQQYEIFASLVDDDSLFGQNDERLMQNAKIFDNFLTTQIDSVLTAFNDRQKNMIKQGVKYDLKPVEYYFKNKPKKANYQGIKTNYSNKGLGYNNPYAGATI